MNLDGFIVTYLGLCGNELAKKGNAAKICQRSEVVVLNNYEVGPGS